MEPVEHRARMKPRAEAEPGLETDGQGRVIPLERRTAEDRAAALGVKNPAPDAEQPAAMREDGGRDTPG